MPDLQPYEARVNVTFNRLNGDLPDPISFDMSDEELFRQLCEALTTGYIPGIPAQEDLSRFTSANFVADRFAPTPNRPYNLIQIRPKTAFGS